MSKALRHGHTRQGKISPEYLSFRAMRARCGNPNSTSYKDYGGRGIVVCNRWLDSFENFLADIGPRPKGSTLDRIDANGNYEPSNCRWASRPVQEHNKRKRSGLTSQFRGVSFHKAARKFVAQISVSNRKLILGRFNSEIDAARAYDAAAKKHYGEFAVLNFPAQISAPWEEAAEAA